MKKATNIQEQNCYIEESVQSCFMRMHLIIVLSEVVLLWHFIRFGVKASGKRLSDF